MLNSLSLMRAKFILKGLYKKAYRNYLVTDKEMTAFSEHYYPMLNQFQRSKGMPNPSDIAQIKWWAATAVAFAYMAKRSELTESSLVLADELIRFSTVATFTQSIHLAYAHENQELGEQFRETMHETVLVKERDIRLTPEAERDVDYLWAILAYHSAYKTQEAEHDNHFQNFLARCKETGTLPYFKKLPEIPRWSDFSDGFNHSLARIQGNLTPQP